EGGQRNLAGDERVIGDQRGLFGGNHRELGGLQRRTVDGAEIAGQRRRGPPAGAKALFSANDERRPRLQLAFGCTQESCQPAEVIVVAVAEHQGVEFCRIDAEQFEIGVESVRGEAEVDEHVARLIAANDAACSERPNSLTIALSGGASPSAQPNRSTSTLSRLKLGATAIW